ncbi:MAG: type II toxin-antitoxin system prevent-host-death family antitoxin [Bryobacteraceae bacterium]
MASPQMKPIAALAAKQRTVTAAEFKATCLALMDEVRDRGVEIVVTKHRKPVAKLVPVPPRITEPFLGRSAGAMEETSDLVAPLAPDWEVDADL